MGVGRHVGPHIFGLVGAVLADEIEHVRDIGPLPQQILAAREIIHPRLRLREPGVGAVEVDAPRPHHHARNGVDVWLVRVAVEEDLVEPLREHLVAQRLHRIGIVLPAAGLRLAGESLGGDDVLAVHVRRGGDHLDRAVVGPGGARPEFGHRHLGASAHLKLVERPGAVTLDQEAKARRVGALLIALIVILDGQVGERAPEVEQEAVGDIQIADDPPRERGEIAQHRIAVARLEIGRQRRRPVLEPGFVAVDLKHVEGVADERPRRLDHSSDAAVILMVDRFPVQLVDLQSAARVGGRDIELAGRRVTEAKDRPAPRRRLPPQRSSSVDLARQVDDLGGVDRIALHQVGRAILARIAHAEAVLALHVPVLDARRGVEQRLGELHLA